MKLIVSVLMIMSLVACKKDKPDCEENNYGWMSCTNFSVPLDLSIDGAPVKRIGTNETYLKDMPTGSHHLKFVRWDKKDSTEQDISIPQCDSVKIWK